MNRGPIAVTSYRLVHSKGQFENLSSQISRKYALVKITISFRRDGRCTFCFYYIYWNKTILNYLRDFHVNNKTKWACCSSFMLSLVLRTLEIQISIAQHFVGSRSSKKSEKMYLIINKVDIKPPTRVLLTRLSVCPFVTAIVALNARLATPTLVIDYLNFEFCEWRISERSGRYLVFVWAEFGCLVLYNL